MLNFSQCDLGRELESLGISLEEVCRIVEIAQHWTLESPFPGDPGEHVHSLLAGALALQKEHLDRLNALADEMMGRCREAA